MSEQAAHSSDERSPSAGSTRWEHGGVEPILGLVTQSHDEPTSWVHGLGPRAQVTDFRTRYAHTRRAGPTSCAHELTAPILKLATPAPDELAPRAGFTSWALGSTTPNFELVEHSPDEPGPRIESESCVRASTAQLHSLKSLVEE